MMQRSSFGTLSTPETIVVDGRGSETAVGSAAGVEHVCFIDDDDLAHDSREDLSRCVF